MLNVNTCKKWTSKKVIDCISTNMRSVKKLKRNRKTDMQMICMHKLAEWLLIGGDWCCRRRIIRFRSWWIKTERSGLPGESCAMSSIASLHVPSFESLSFLLGPLLTYLSYIPSFEFFSILSSRVPCKSPVSLGWVTCYRVCCMWSVNKRLLRLFVAVDL